MKLLLLFSLFTFSSASFAINLSPVLRDQNRSVILLTASDAYAYCNKIGSRLPTAKEIAMFFNPSGIEFSPKSGFEPIKIDEDSQAFFYDYSTYTSDQSDQGEYFTLWTNSVRIDYSQASSPYEFDVLSGRLIINASADKNNTVAAVRCVY